MNHTARKSKLDAHLRLSDDRLAVLFDGIVPDLQDETLRSSFAEALEDDLANLGVDPIPDTAELLSRLTDTQPGEDGRLKDAVLLEGTPPIPPKDGFLEWARDFFSSGFVIDEKTGAMDYREHTGDPSVDEGELLGRVHPPMPGEDGRDVLGNRLPAEKPKAVRVRCGANVKPSDEGNEFFAASKGRVRYSKQVLSVDPVYVIQGNVGLESGNIEHPGALIVEGDIEAGAQVRADGDIEVSGIIEAADVEAGGSLVVRRGITGGDGHRIKADGRVQVRFLVETQVEAGDDVIVESEMVNSRVVTRGSFIMPGGRLVGGSVTAQGNIRLRQAGSEGIVATRLAIEVDPALARAITEKENEMKSIRDSLKKIKETLAALKRKRDALSDGAREALAKLAGNISGMQATLQSIESDRQELLALMRNRGRPQIVIQGVAHPETTFDIFTHRLRLREALMGPMRAVVGRNGLEFQPVAESSPGRRRDKQ